uniref:Uncharacterized protein n=1 Tax=Anguilla anguilla TaxID=7936 RepID=A0A0E9PWH8_ANGAN
MNRAYLATKKLLPKPNINKIISKIRSNSRENPSDILENKKQKYNYIGSRRL